MSLTSLAIQPNGVYGLTAVKSGNQITVKEAFKMSNQASRENILDLIVSGKVDELAEILTYLATHLKAVNNKWLVSLPLSLMIWKLETPTPTSLHSLDADDEELQIWSMKWLPDLYDKEKYRACISSIEQHGNSGYVTVAFVLKSIIETLIKAFRKTNMDLLTIEPDPVSISRYLKTITLDKIIDESEEEIHTQSVYLDKQGTLVICNKLGILTAKASENFEEQLKILYYSQKVAEKKFAGYKPEKTFHYTSIPLKIIKEYQGNFSQLPLTPYLNFKNVDIDNFCYVVNAGGLLLSELDLDLNNKKGGLDGIVRKFFKNRNSKGE